MRIFLTTTLTLLLLVNDTTASIPEGQYQGTVIRQSLSTKGLSDELKKFWGKTVFPMKQKALVRIYSEEGQYFGEVGLSPSDPSLYHDTILFQKRSKNRLSFKGNLPGDSGWIRKTTFELWFLPSRRARFTIGETDINRDQGYKMKYSYKGVVKAPTPWERITKRLN